jgi:hypothetical protein
MATVGFGDISVANTVEVWFAIVAMLFGATVFGFVIGTVGVFFSSLTESSMRHNARMNDLVTYMHHHKVPVDIYSKTCMQYDYYLKRKSAFDEDVILGQLTYSLRQEVRGMRCQDNPPPPLHRPAAGLRMACFLPVLFTGDGAVGARCCWCLLLLIMMTTVTTTMLWLSLYRLCTS